MGITKGKARSQAVSPETWTTANLPSGPLDMQDAIAALAMATSPQTDRSEFFSRCVALLARAYNCRYAFIGVFNGQNKRQIRTLAVNAHGKPGDNFIYDLAYSPCEQVLAHEQAFVPDGASDIFAKDELLVKMGLQSYFGTALINSRGETLGLVVVTDTKPMSGEPWILPVLELFANRIAMELEQEDADTQLRLAASVFSHSKEGMMVVDPTGTILKVNNAFTTITGYKAHEAMGQHFRLLRSDHNTPVFFRKLWITLIRHGVWEGEIWSRRKHGAVYPERRTILAVKDDHGKIVHFVSIFEDISMTKFASERIHRLAYYDVLTDLPNRQYLAERLAKAVSYAKRTKTYLVLIFIDLDGFKLVNDSYGHTTGDQLLLQIAQRISRHTREEDTLARVGGDEFVLLMEKLDSPEDIALRAQTLIDTISEQNQLKGEALTLTASLGISIYPSDGTDPQELLRNADAAMYHAKQQGKNQFVFYENELNLKALKRLRLTRHLQKAIENGDFYLEYQPQFRLSDGALSGVEALLRWHKADQYLTQESLFPLAEESGLIVPIGKWVINEACKQLRDWLDQGVNPGRLAINLSGRQINHPHLVPHLQHCILDYQLCPNQIELEIRESWLMADPEAAFKNLSLLKQMGVAIVIDDFGVAYSSMAYLKRFPVDKLKIDQSFIDGLPGDPNDSAIVQAIIAMGHSLGILIVAEGVETKKQATFLALADCDAVQGYLYSQPLPPEKLTSFILDKSKASEEAMTSKIEPR